MEKATKGLKKRAENLCKWLEDMEDDIDWIHAADLYTWLMWNEHELPEDEIQRLQLVKERCETCGNRFWVTRGMRSNVNACPFCNRQT